MRQELQPKPAYAATAALNARMREPLDFINKRDAKSSVRDPLSQDQITGPAGQVVFGWCDYDFLDDDIAPDTMNPSLRRQARLNVNPRLFEMPDRIDQTRGNTIANVTNIEGEAGLTLNDALATRKTGAAARELYCCYHSRKPIAVLIHSRTDLEHYGCVCGIISRAATGATEVSVSALVGFLEANLTRSLFEYLSFCVNSGEIAGRICRTALTSADSHEQIVLILCSATLSDRNETNAGEAKPKVTLGENSLAYRGLGECDFAEVYSDRSLKLTGDENVLNGLFVDFDDFHLIFDVATGTRKFA